jgi:cation:H+ antiporter
LPKEPTEVTKENMLEFNIDGMNTALPAVLVGLVILLGAGEFLVKGSVALASKLGIPRLIIGMTIVAFGTSVPELFIGIQSVMQGSPGLALGNVVGSNIANVLLVLGVPSIIYPTLVKEHGVRRNTTMMMIATIVFLWMAFDGELTFSDGATLVFLVALFFGLQIHHAKTSPNETTIADELADLEGASNGNTAGIKVFVFILIGLIGLPLGANALVSGSVYVAGAMGVDETIIGLSLVALGTSLPELAISVVATLRRHASVAIGNVIGSNILNIVAVMGISTLFAGKSGIPVTSQFIDFDLWVMFAASAVLVPFAFAKRGSITRIMGIVFIVLYVSYIFWIFKNGMV